MYGPDVDLVRPSAKEKDSLLKMFDIPVHHLDFAYVANCKNAGELEKIVQILRSGEEGYFPELTEAALNQLKAVKPNSKFVREVGMVLHKSGLSKEEKTQLNGELLEWLQNVGKCEQDLKDRSNRNVQMPTVRRTKGALKNGSKEVKRIKSTDYSAWDKYDPDAELLKIDMEAEMRKKEIEKEAKPKVQKGSFPTRVEAELAAKREREKGNEFYRAGDYELALIHYTNCINYMPTVAGYNNRALTNYKLQKYKDAVADCTQALRQDPGNVKANLRAALSYRALKNHRKAIGHAEQVIKVDPNNAEAQKLIGALNTGSAKAKTRMKIEEVDNGKVLLAIPGPSSMPEPYYVAVENKDKEIIKRQEYVLNSRRQMLHFPNLKLTCDDEDCMEVHGNCKSSDANRPSSLSVTEVEFERGDGENIVTEQDNTAVVKGETIKTDQTLEKEDNNKELTSVKNKNLTEHVTLNKVTIAESSLQDTETTPLHTEKLLVIQDNESQRCTTTLQTESKLHTSGEYVIQEYKNHVETKQNCSMSANIATNLVPNLDTNGACMAQGNMNKSNRRQAILLEDGNKMHSGQNDVALVEINKPYGFLKSWRSAKNDGQKRAEILRALDCSCLHKVIGNKLDGSMLGEILSTLRKHFKVVDEADRVRDILMSLTNVPRFTMVVMFLTNKDKTYARSLLKLVEDGGKPVDDNVKQMYS